MFHSDSAFATLTSQTLTHEQKLMTLAKAMIMCRRYSGCSRS